MADRIIYKNHCTPQEKLGFAAGDRWYLDSDTSARFTGGANAGITATLQPVYVASTTLSTSAVTIGASTQDFVFIKNLGSTANNVLISLDGTGGKYRIKLAPGESFAAEIGQASAGSENNDVFMKTDTGAQTVETLRGT